MEDSTYQAARKKPLEERRARAYQYARPRSSTTRTTTSTATSTATTSMPSSTLFCLTIASTLQLGAATYDLVPSYHEVAVFGNAAETMAGLLTFLLMVIAVFFLYVRPSVPWPLRTLLRATLHHACTQTESQSPDGPPGLALALPLRQSHEKFVQTDQGRHQSEELGGSLRTTLETTATRTALLLKLRVWQLQNEVQGLLQRLGTVPRSAPRVDDVGNVYPCPRGQVWHCSEDCARSKSGNRIDPILRRPCYYCTNTEVVVPDLPGPSTAAPSTRR